jgi:hypothetical protein
LFLQGNTSFNSNAVFAENVCSDMVLPAAGWILRSLGGLQAHEESETDTGSESFVTI